MSIRLSRRLFLAAAGAAVLPVSARAEARRVISVGAPVTEIVFALGCGGEVVAVDTTSHFPDAARDLPKVGYMRALSAEGLASLAPSLVLAETGSGPKAALDGLRALGIRVVLADERPAADGLADKIAAIGRELGREAAAARLAADVAARFAAVSDGLAGRPVLCLAHVLDGRLLAAGEGTVGDALIRIAGGRNAFAPAAGHRLASAEALVAAAPEMLVVGAAMLEGLGGLDALLARPDLALAPVAKTRRVAVIDDTLMIGFGPRTPDAVAAIVAAA